jgi:hypothetical protein
MSLLMRKLAGRTQRLALGIVFWLALTVTGLAVLTVYSLTPGASHPPLDWNEASLPGELPEGKHLLVMALHPHCPCSRASLGELARLLRLVHPQLACQILVYSPAENDLHWQTTDLLRTAAALPETQLVADREGRLAARLGMHTSGAVVLYDPYGAAQFYGGITASRNHHGDNQGGDAIRALVEGESPALRQTLVYGCPIQGDTPSGIAAQGPHCEVPQP